MRDYHGCSICGRKFPEDALTLFAGDYFCEHCLDGETVVCSDCGERLWNDANAGSRTHPLCQRCYDSHYTNCERCGELIDCENAYYLGDGEDYPYCENCYHILKNQVLPNNLQQSQCVHVLSNKIKQHLHPPQNISQSTFLIPLLS